MNAKVNEMSALSLDELIALKKNLPELQAVVAGDLARLAELNGQVADAKNAADHGNTQKGALWGVVFSIMSDVWTMTEETPKIRHLVFTDLLGEYMNPVQVGEAKPKVSTAGNYASTARKLLTGPLTEGGKVPDDFREKSFAEVRTALRPVTDQAAIKAASETNKRIRYIIKHGTADEKRDIALVMVEVEKLYLPVKDRKEKSKNAAKADATLRDNRQQAPTEPATLETVAADIVGGEEKPNAKAVGEE